MVGGIAQQGGKGVQGRKECYKTPSRLPASNTFLDCFPNGYDFLVITEIASKTTPYKLIPLKLSIF